MTGGRRSGCRGAGTRRGSSKIRALVRIRSVIGDPEWERSWYAGAKDNKVITARALEGAWSAAGTVSLEDVYADDFVGHQLGPTGDLSGLGALQSFVAAFHAAFPDFQDTVGRQVAEGSYVVSQFTSVGTHRGDFMGLPATGRRVEWQGIEIARLEEGKIVENWVSWDEHGMRRQMGDAP